MISTCPFCKKKVEGSPISKQGKSLRRSIYKFYLSLIIPIPFVGSYIGGKVYDWLSSPDEWFHRFFCPRCRCSWIATEIEPDIKIGGNQNLIAFYGKEYFIIGNVKEDFYMTQIPENGKIKNVVLFKDECNIKANTYINGHSNQNSKIFMQIMLNIGLYIGETTKLKPDGWGVLFDVDGHIWYGAWSLGIKQGIGFECDFDGEEYRAGYWSNNLLTM